MISQRQLIRLRRGLNAYHDTQLAALARLQSRQQKMQNELTSLSDQLTHAHRQTTNLTLVAWVSWLETSIASTKSKLAAVDRDIANQKVQATKSYARICGHEKLEKKHTKSQRKKVTRNEINGF